MGAEFTDVGAAAFEGDIAWVLWHERLPGQDLEAYAGKAVPPSGWVDLGYL